MGMYTELVVSTRVKNDPEVIAILRYMGGEIETPPDNLPAHPFFKTGRWNRMFQCCSYYFVPHTVFKLDFDKISKDWSLTVRCDFKNYDNEINHFADWIRPHLETRSFREPIGYYRYEESDHPTVLYTSEEVEAFNS